MEKFIKETILKAGDAVMKHFGSTDVLYKKEKETDIVTEADLASHEIIVSAIKENYPDHGIVSEESEGYKIEAPYVWYLDPLDGTKNFASGVSLFGINLALTFNGEVVNAAIYLPAMKELVYAEKGKGTFLNNKKVECSKKQDWNGVYGLGPVRYSNGWVNFLKLYNEVSKETGWSNAVASPAVCAVWISNGRRDWYIGPGKNSWDYAAPYLIAKEAGCSVSNFAGEEWKPGDRGLIVTNKYLYPRLLEIVKESYSQ